MLRQTLSQLECIKLRKKGAELKTFQVIPVNKSESDRTTDEIAVTDMSSVIWWKKKERELRWYIPT